MASSGARTVLGHDQDDYKIPLVVNGHVLVRAAPNDKPTREIEVTKPLVVEPRTRPT